MCPRRAPLRSGIRQVGGDKATQAPTGQIRRTCSEDSSKGLEQGPT